MKKIAALIVGLMVICAAVFLSGYGIHRSADSDIACSLSAPFLNDHKVIEVVPIEKVNPVYEISRNERIAGHVREAELRANSPPNLQAPGHRIRSDT